VVTFPRVASERGLACRGGECRVRLGLGRDAYCGCVRLYIKMLGIQNSHDAARLSNYGNQLV
jgi:hypothetical protein